jgi:hypothetical protein
MEVNLQGYADRPRGAWVSRVLLLVALVSGLTILVTNIWQWRLDFGPHVAWPKTEIDPPLADPQTLHRSLISLPAGAVAVPYQAGGFEVQRVVPAELTVYYKHNRRPHEARVVLYTRPAWERWRLLTPKPGASWLTKRWSDDRLLAALRVSIKPSWTDRLVPWRLVRWTALRQIHERVLIDDQAELPHRLWRTRFDELVAVGREYKFARGTNRLTAVTGFGPRGAVDLRFAFSHPDDDNDALVRAWLEGLSAPDQVPDNQAGLLACEGVPGAHPNQPEIRVCRQLYLIALWHSQGMDPTTTTHLVDSYILAGDLFGLRVLHDQLAQLRLEDAPARQEMSRIAEAMDRLSAKEQGASGKGAKKSHE